MKQTELIQKYKALSTEQKENLKNAWYYHKGGSYWMLASFQLQMAGAECGFFVPFSWVKNQKKYERKGAKVNFIFYCVIDKLENWESEFKGYNSGRIVNVKYLKNKDWSNADIQDIKKEVTEYKYTKKENVEKEKKDLQKIASEALSSL